MHNTRPINRHVRALRILNCLQSGPQYSAKDFATLFNVSRRTIYRDLELLRAAGVEFHYDGEHDAYTLATHQVPMPTFHMEDVTLLALSASLSMLSSWNSMHSITREIVSKLLSNYPQQVRAPASRLITACIPEITTHGNDKRAGEVLDVLFRSIQHRKQARLCFLVNKEFRFSKVAPYRIVLGQGRWTLIGRSSWHRRTESFDSSQVHSAQLTEDTFTTPRNFRFRNVPMKLE